MGPCFLNVISHDDRLSFPPDYRRNAFERKWGNSREMQLSCRILQDPAGNEDTQFDQTFPDTFEYQPLAKVTPLRPVPGAPVRLRPSYSRRRLGIVGDCVDRQVARLEDAQTSDVF